MVAYRYTFGSVVFDEATMTLWVGDERSDVDPQPLRVLSMLLRAEGRLVPMKELIRQLTTEAAVTKSISRLRSALGDQCHYVLTVRSRGYRFDTMRGALERTASGDLAGSALDLQPGDPPLSDRADLVLQYPLAEQPPATEAWVARSSVDSELHVFRYATDGAGLPFLKRALVLQRLLAARLGPRHDIPQVRAHSLTDPPFFLECTPGGQPMERWAREQLGGMDLAGRLSLFLQLAHTVKDLHGIGLVLNDIQPGNLLVSRVAEGWQIRLSSLVRCRLLDPSGLKDYGIDTLGLTPAQIMGAGIAPARGPHVAPELYADAPASLRSDVHALGVLLYQLLVGDMRRALLPGWQRGVQEELMHADIAGATDGDPECRTESVAALIEGLESLDSRRVRRDQEARRQTQERIARRQRVHTRARRPWVIGAMAVLVVATAGDLLQAYRFHVVAQRAQQEQEEKDVALGKDLPVMADPLASQDDRTSASQESLATMERLSASIKDPTRKSAVLAGIAKAYGGWARYDKAEALLREAAALRERALGPADPLTLEAAYLRARALMLLTDFKKADALLVEIDRLAGARLHAPTQLAMLSLWVHAGGAVLQSRPDLALPLYEKAEQLRVHVVPDDLTWRFRTQDGLASCYVRMNRSPEAVELLQRLMGPGWMLGLDRIEWIRTRFQYGVALRNVGRFKDAVNVAQETLHDSGWLLGARHHLTGLSWGYAGVAYQDAGRLQEALRAQRTSHEILESSAGSLGRVTLIALGDLGGLEYLNRNLQQAVVDLRSAQQGMVKVLGPAAPATQLAEFHLAAALNDTGHADEAWLLASQLEPAALAAADAGGFWDERLQGLKGQILMSRGKMEQGHALVLQALAALRHRPVQPWVLAQLRGRNGTPHPVQAAGNLRAPPGRALPGTE